MGIRKDIKEIRKKVDSLTNETINKAKKYDELINNLNKIKIKIDKTSFFVDEYGKIALKIDYQIPPIRLYFDDNDDVIKNETFYSLNILNLVPMEEQLKIVKKIEEAKNKNVLNNF